MGVLNLDELASTKEMDYIHQRTFVNCMSTVVSGLLLEQLIHSRKFV